MTTGSFENSLLSHRDWIQSVIRSRVREHDMVDDLVNEVMTEAIAFESTGTIHELAPWLYRVAIRKVLQFRRTLARRRKHQQAFCQHKVSAAETTWLQEPIEVVLGQERDERIRQAIQNLNGQDAEILTLKYVHQWNYQQLATHLGFSITKVTHRLRRARGRLKSELCRLGIGENHE